MFATSERIVSLSKSVVNVIAGHAPPFARSSIPCQRVVGSRRAVMRLRLSTSQLRWFYNLEWSFDGTE